MALFGRSPRMDGRRSSSYCSTATFVVFIALCLIGLWMMTTSTVIPVDMSSSKNKSDMKSEIAEMDSNTVEDRSIDTSSNPVQGDADRNANDSPNEDGSDSAEEQNVIEKTTENSVEKSEEENPANGNDGTKDDSDKTSKDQSFDDANGGTKDEPDNASKNQSFDDENGKTEGGELVKGGDENGSGERGGQDKDAEVNREEVNNNNGEEKEGQSGDDTTDKERTEDSDKISSENEVSNKQDTDGEKNSETQEKDEDNQGQKEEKEEQNQDKDTEKDSGEVRAANQTKDESASEVYPDGAQSEILNETTAQNGAWSTQRAESKNEKELQSTSLTKRGNRVYSWKLCNVTAGADYIPCLDNEEAIKKLRSTKHYEHRERHCPDEAPPVLDKIWYHNVPHPKLANVKGHQNWVKVSGEYLSFPGGGTQFKHGALHYINFIEESFPDIAWGKRSRVVLDVGCGVASFGGYLFDRDVLTMSFAPKDEHEAQVQFALERGIPAILAVMGTRRLPFPSRVFDVIHCARCRVPWHIEGGMLLLELNRLLRPGGYFVWSATPVYQKLPEDVEIWKAMSALTKSMCWEMVNKTKDSVNQVGLAIFRKPSNNDCYEKRTENDPPLCQESDDPNAAWNVSLQACMHNLPVDPNLRGSQWPEKWPQRLVETPYWLNNSQVGVYGKPAPEDFKADYEHWKHVVSNSYVNGMGIKWSNVRNAMDMRSVYGGFAAALRDMKVWVMNIVTIDSPDTLPIIYERGLFGMYHDWCESFNTYPRTYDLLHADHLFSKIKKRCKLLSVIAEVDRILRPEGKLIVRDETEIINEVESIAKSLQWEIRMAYSKENEDFFAFKRRCGGLKSRVQHRALV
uniref:Methyltransferase PMT26 n=1 Tax=Ananas comosus var. bracteatus TaxID=296719 RepID=A0A6V7QFX3_ANACO|nr:unnamed protein product [Ananas comosus var. bracteatus]